MKISAKVDYACRVLAEMARLHGSGELTQIERLARIEAIPSNFLAQILCELRDSGLITSKRGNQGGYALARAPEQITLLEIIKAIDGELIDFSTTQSGRSGRRMKEVWTQLRSVVEEWAHEVTLDTIAAKAESEMYHI
jgi:Rrf2 family cysteine metabolism transcriptional repressor